MNRINDKPFFLLFCYGLFLRMFLALSGDFLLNQDEVMQYLEQGHRLAYGYGLIPWEYRVGMRSLIIPYFIAFWLKFFSYAGLSQPTEYITGIKIVFCLLSMCIPLGMYKFCKKTYSKKTAYVALFIGCSWYELIMAAHKPLSEFFSTELIFLGIYFFNCNNIRFFYAAILFTCIAAAVRPHIAPAVLILLIYYFNGKSKKIVFNSILVIATSVVIIGIFEYATLGLPWSSYYFYFYYNVILNIVSDFGAEPLSTYLWVFLVTSVGLFYFSLLYAFNRDDINKNIMPILCIIVLFFSHSIIAHKEYRFVYPVIPFWLILLSAYLSELISKNRPYRRTLLIISTISGLGLNGLLPKQQLAIHLTNHSGKSYFKRSDSLKAYLYLSTLNDDGGVIDYTYAWPQSGGYYYLHRKVPLNHTVINPQDNYRVQQSIQSEIINGTLRYIITYEKITDDKVNLIKTFGKINIYKIINKGKKTIMDNYNFNRYLPNIPL